MAASAKLFLQPEHWERMLAHVRRDAPLEACGLIGGRDGQSAAVFDLPNELHSPYRFRIDPRQQVRIFNLLDEKGWDLIGIYHSHPAGPPVPSPTDVAENYYPDAVHLIWSPTGGKWGCRGFIIEGGQVHEVEVEVGLTE